MEIFKTGMSLTEITNRTQELFDQGWTSKEVVEEFRKMLKTNPKGAVEL